MYIDGDRSGARTETEAARGGALLRTRGLPRDPTAPGRADGLGRARPWRPGASAAGRCPAQARRQRVRLRAGSPLRDLAADGVASPQGTAPGRARRLGAARTLGLLLRDPRCTGGAV